MDRSLRLTASSAAIEMPGPRLDRLRYVRRGVHYAVCAVGFAAVAPKRAGPRRYPVMRKRKARSSVPSCILWRTRCCRVLRAFSAGEDPYAQPNTIYAVVGPSMLLQTRCVVLETTSIVYRPRLLLMSIRTFMRCCLRALSPRSCQYI